MTQALIQVNGTDGSNDNLPIATLVSLDNHGNGGELTYLWSIVSQPTGTADALSSTTIANPTFTPNKEGTYLLELVVNEGLPDEATATAIVGVRDLKTFQRIPAAGETIEDGTTGWSGAADGALQTALQTRADSNLIVCWSHNTAVLNQLVKFGGTQVIKSGLPGQETVALTAAAGSDPFVGAIVGPCKPGGPVANALVFVRTVGLFENSLSGSPSVGDPVYIDTSTSLPSLGGTTEIGRVVLAAGGSYRFAIHSPPGTSGGGGITGIDVETGNVLVDPLQVVASADGTKMYVACGAIVGVVDASTKEVLAVISGATAPIAISADGDTLYAISNVSNELLAISTATDAVVATISIGAGPYLLAVTPDSARAFVLNIDDSTCTVINTSTHAVIATSTLTSPEGVTAWHLVTRPDSAYAYASDGDTAIFQIDSSDGSVTTTGSLDDPTTMIITPDSTTMYFDNAFDTAYALTLSTMTVAATIALASSASTWFSVMAPDGSQAYFVSSGAEPDYITCIATADNSTESFESFGADTTAIALSIDGSTMYIADDYPQLGGYSVPNSSTDNTGSVDGLLGEVTSMAVSSTGIVFGTAVDGETLWFDVSSYDYTFADVNGEASLGNFQTMLFTGGVGLTDLGSGVVEINVPSLWAPGSGTGAVIQNNQSGNQASGDYSIAEGYDTLATGDYSHTEGRFTSASGGDGEDDVYGSHAEGDSTTASGAAAHAEGSNAVASGEASHAEGRNTTASGDYSHAESLGQAGGRGSHAEGQGSTSGQYSHAEGNGTNAEGDYSHAEGLDTTAIGTASHAEGNGCTANGNYSHAEGENTTTGDDADYARAYGVGANASRPTQAAHGNAGTQQWPDSFHQTSLLVMSGQTPGSTSGESTELYYGIGGVSGELVLDDDHGYVVVLTAIAKGDISSTPAVQSWRQTIVVRRTSGTTTIAASGVAEQLGDVAAVSWTFAASVGSSPDRLALTFSTGSTTSAVDVCCKVEFTEVLNPFS